jgi:acetylornithine deacetylase
MTPTEILATIDTKACLAILSRMVQHKSYTETQGEQDLVRHMVQQMRALGLEADETPVPGNRINAIGRLRGTGGAPSLLFNGHLDTNPATEGWTVDPWGGLVDDRFIYGIGVSNMKAGDAAYFCAVKTLVDAGIKLRGDVILTFVVGELQGGVGTVAFIDQGLRADYFVNAEPTDLKAITMHAGGGHFVIELTGNTRHLSKREEAVDALAAAAELVPIINGMTFSGALSDEHRAINRGHVGVLHAALGRDLHEWRAPQVADFARLKGTARYAPGQTRQGAMDDLRQVLKAAEARHPGLQAVLIPRDENDRPSMPPFEVAKDARIVQTLNRAYHQVRGTPQPTGALAPAGFYGTDASHLLHRANMQGIVCGPRRPLQHHARRTRRHRRLPRHDPHQHPHHPRHLRTAMPRMTDQRKA